MGRSLWCYAKRSCRSFASASEEIMETGALIVGAGPAGLSMAIRLKQLNPSFPVMVLEKSSEVGRHILSGAVLEPRALFELFPSIESFTQHEYSDPFPSDPVPLITKVKEDRMYWMTRRWAFRLPLLPVMHNANKNWIISLSDLVRWLGRRAEELGVEVYSGFAGNQLWIEDDKVQGVITNDFGKTKDGQPKAGIFQPGLRIKAQFTVLAEGAHGSLTKQAKIKFRLQDGRQPQTYGIGLKEVWRVQPERHEPGFVYHTVGYPLDLSTYGGSFAYHYGENLVSLGLVVGLDYQNPHLNPYWEFQKLKLHPLIKEFIRDGECLAYGARVINEGGIQCIPKLTFPSNGLLIGCSSGFVNVPKIKGTHTAMKSGILAAECVHDVLNSTATIESYEERIRQSWIWEELNTVRNVRPSFQRLGGVLGGMFYSAIDVGLFRGRLPWTIKFNRTDHGSLRPAAECLVPEYPKPDNALTFDLMTSVSRTGTFHEEDQPCHLRLKYPHSSSNQTAYAEVESKFCPAGVYEYLEDLKATHGKRFHINAQNCIHCKTCDIKDPSQNIDWTCPEGGGGPRYTGT